MILGGFDFDTFKAEIPMAIRSFRRRRKLKWLSAFCVCLFLISPPSTWLFASVRPLLRQVFRQLVIVFNSHIFVFMFFNAMILIVYSLSGLEKRTEDKSPMNRISDEFANDGEPSRGIATVAEVRERLESAADDSVAEKWIVYENNADSPAIEVAIAAVTVAEIPKFVGEVTEIVTGSKPYRRTESERYERREKSKFRRSNTDIDEDLVTVGGERRRFSCSVGEMDIDDFNHTIESFIAEQKWQQREEFREEQIIATEM